MNAASRGVISLFLQNAYFPDRQACLDALADAMRVAYCTFLEAGQALRLDGPELALSRHMLVTALSDAGFLTMAAPPLSQRWSMCLTDYRATISAPISAG